MDFKQRLLKELGELNGRIYLLGKYIGERPEEETVLEQKQQAIMMEYLRILEARILNLMNKEG